MGHFYVLALVYLHQMIASKYKTSYTKTEMQNLTVSQQHLLYLGETEEVVQVQQEQPEQSSMNKQAFPL